MASITSVRSEGPQITKAINVVFRRFRAGGLKLQSRWFVDPAQARTFISEEQDRGVQVVKCTEHRIARSESVW